MLLSGYSALSEYSMLSPTETKCFASDSIASLEKESSIRLQHSADQCVVELWRYDPGKLTDGKSVDRLSLSLALADDRDERVEEAVEYMLDDIWRDIDGSRNR